MANGERSEEELSSEPADAPERLVFSSEDSDGSRPDPVAMAARFRQMVEETGSIECPCGWKGDATEARISGGEGTTDIGCPACRRWLFILYVEDA